MARASSSTAVSGPAEGAERLRFRRSAAAHAQHLAPAMATCWSSISRRFKYILVDEYQDTNQVQYLWLRLLAQARKNICVVGDDDQSIYSWRGAEVANILRFEKDFPGAAVIKLEQNYRSTPQILAAASGLINANSERLGKTLWTELPAGDKVRVIGVWDATRRSAPRRRGDRAAGALRESPLDEVAILVRAQYQTREFEDRFIQIGLNYRIIGGFRFYERAEIRDALAYLRVIAQPADDLAFERIYNQPKRGLGAKALETMHRHARAPPACRWPPPRWNWPIATNCPRARATRWSACWPVRALARACRRR